jgi:hypothetical protein
MVVLTLLFNDIVDIASRIKIAFGLAGRATADFVPPAAAVAGLFRREERALHGGKNI